MENKKNNGASHMPFCCCGKPLGVKIIKMLIIFILLAMIFFCGVCVGAQKGYFEKWHKNNKMYGMSFNYPVLGPEGEATCAKSQFAYGPKFMMGNFFHDERGKEANFQMDRFFGKIIKLEGNLITVMDNATNEQTVISQSSTVIMSKTGEIGLTALTIGQNIVSYGSFNANKQFEARLIEAL